MLSIVLIFSLSLTSHANLKSNFSSRYSILFQCSSGPYIGYIGLFVIVYRDVRCTGVFVICKGYFSAGIT